VVSVTDNWVDPGRHPRALAPYDDGPAVNGMTLRQLVDWAQANGHALEDVQVDYADCGTHRVVLYARREVHYHLIAQAYPMPEGTTGWACAHCSAKGVYLASEAEAEVSARRHFADVHQVADDL
jgi:hypothetical protein